MLKPETKENLKQTFKESFLILMYECIGTAMMTVLILNFYAQISFPDCTVNDIPDTKETNTCIVRGTDGVCTERKFDYEGCKVIDNVGLLLGMFVTIMFSARISGSHFNPCITFSYMIGNVKQGKFDRILGLLYIAA